MKKRKLLCFSLLAVLLPACICLGIYLKQVFDYKQAVQNTVIEDIDLTQVPDGTYFGEYDVSFISAKVKVIVHNSTIEQVELLEHKNDRGTAAETIVTEIIKQQKIAVDAVTGATNSSIVIKKAVENALRQIK